MENTHASSSFESISYYSSSNYVSSRKGSYRFLKGHNRSSGSPRFLDSCHLCNKRLGDGRDIYMYRGDTPFCSEECRQQQIEIDDEAAAKEKKSDKSTAIPSKSNTIEVRAVSTAVAC